VCLSNHFGLPALFQSSGNEDIATLRHFADKYFEDRRVKHDAAKTKLTVMVMAIKRFVPNTS